MTLLWLFSSMSQIRCRQMDEFMDISLTYQITPFENTAHRSQVIALWEAAFGYEAPHNAPDLVIEKKRAVDDGLFFVALVRAT